jgi:hypothetical protein
LFEAKKGHPNYTEPATVGMGSTVQFRVGKRTPSFRETQEMTSETKTNEAKKLKRNKKINRKNLEIFKAFFVFLDF